jgi:hypothetical protein
MTSKHIFVGAEENHIYLRIAGDFTDIEPKDY